LTNRSLQIYAIIYPIIYIIDLVSEGIGGEVVVEDGQGVVHEVRDADGDEEVVAQLQEELQPLLSDGSGTELWVSQTNHEDLHVLPLQVFELVVDHVVDEGVGEEYLVEVVDIALELVVEGEVAQSEEKVLASWNCKDN